MMRYLLILVFCLTGLAGFAQASFQWGMEAYPNYSHRRLIAQTGLTQKQIQELENRETGRFSWSAGAFVQWKGQRAGFQTGLRFADSGYRSVRMPLTADDTPPQGATAKREEYQSLFIEAPAEVQFYHELSEKNEFFFMLGLSMAYNLANRNKTIYYTGETNQVDVTTPDKEAFSNVHYSFLTGMGWEHHLSEGFTMVLQPTFQFWMSNLLVEADVNRSLYSVGLRLGVKF